MKTLMILMCLLVVFIQSPVSCIEGNQYRIIGNVSGIPDSTTIGLWVYYDDVANRIDTAIVINGKFSFIDTIRTEKVYMSLMFGDMLHYSGKCEFWPENTDITIIGYGKYLSQWVASSDSKEQLQLNNLYNHIRNYKIELDSLMLIRSSANRGSEKEKAIRPVIDSIYKIITNKKLLFLSENYNSFTAVRELCSIAQFSDSAQKETIMTFYKKIDTVYTNTLKGEGIKNFLNKVVPPKAGDKYIDVTAFDLEGKSHKLSDYLGKYILLDFWSAACFACVKAAPELKKISAKYSKNLYVIGLSQDTKKKLWEEGSKKDSGHWINLSDGKGAFAGAGYLYGINALPTYLLINPEGIIVERTIGFREGKFEELLSKHHIKKGKTKRKK